VHADAVYGTTVTPEPSAWLLWATALAVLIVAGVMRRQTQVSLCRASWLGPAAKRKDGIYEADRRQSSWVKVKNPTYSQKDGRWELF